MIKRIGFIVMVCWALSWAYSKGVRPTVELDQSIRLWGYQLRLGLLVAVSEVPELADVAQPASCETGPLPADTVGLAVVPAAGELP